MQLQGQVALITGAGRGIGKAIALRFAREGADIALLDLNSEWAQSTGEEIKALGRRTFVKTVDVSHCEQVQAAVHEAAATLGRLDVIVNNAGIGKAQHFLSITKENWERHINIHLNGTILLCAGGCAGNGQKEVWPHHQYRLYCRTDWANRPCSVRSREGRNYRYDTHRSARSGGLWDHGQCHRTRSD